MHALRVKDTLRTGRSCYEECRARHTRTIDERPHCSFRHSRGTHAVMIWSGCKWCQTRFGMKTYCPTVFTPEKEVTGDNLLSIAEAVHMDTWRAAHQVQRLERCDLCVRVGTHHSLNARCTHRCMRLAAMSAADLCRCWRSRPHCLQALKARVRRRWDMHCMACTHPTLSTSINVPWWICTRQGQTQNTHQ